MSYLDDFVEKLNKLPNEVMSILRTIRDMDKNVEELKVELQRQKAQFYKALEVWQNKKTSRDKQRVDKLYIQITKKDKKIHELSKQKVKLAQNLYNLVHEPTQKLTKEINLRGGEKGSAVNQLMFKKKKSRRQRQSMVKQSWQYAASEPVYCYCIKPSYGEMIMCQNTDCQRQWFHIDCIDEKFNSLERWYCKNCRKEKDHVVIQKKRKKR